MYMKAKSYVPSSGRTYFVAIDVHDRVDPLPGVERELHLVGGRRQTVAEQILEQELSEAASRLRRPQGLLEPCEVLGPLEHLRGRLVDLAEPLVDLVGCLRSALETAVDLGVERRKAPVHRLDHALEPAVDLGVPLGQLAARFRAEGAELPAKDPGDDASERGCCGADEK